MNKNTKAPQTQPVPPAPDAPDTAVTDINTTPSDPIEESDALPVVDADSDAPAPDAPDTAESEDPDSEQGEAPTLKEREAELNARLVALAADYSALTSDIQAEGDFYAGFRKVKETFFRLQRISAHNGNIPERRERTGKPNRDQFVRGGNAPAQSEAPEKREAPKPRTDLFERSQPSAEVEPTKFTNPKVRALFQRSAPPPPPAEPVIRGKKAPTPPDNKRKLLASSEENDD